MSHDSGFRKGSHDFAQKSGPRDKRQDRAAKAFESRMVRRFHEHEQEVKAQAQPETGAEDKPAEDET